ncbi:hypothetical protein GE061_001399 [Apolygus lucorum]|uniref:Uncharacterized protein n=1 Tax=Apolygus lucorum TaxID=248454 RepID=A0A8S9YAX7_APOLU|nr:hypothetical protein GE061_001399 [Apolygus lucorum]
MNPNTRGAKILGLLDPQMPPVPDENNLVKPAHLSPPPTESLHTENIHVYPDNDDVLPSSPLIHEAALFVQELRDFPPCPEEKMLSLPTTAVSEETVDDVNPFEALIQQAEIVINSDDSGYDPIEGTSYSVVVNEENPTIIRLTKIHNHNGNNPSISNSSDDEQDIDDDPNFSDSNEFDNGAENSDSRSSSSLEVSRNPNSASSENFRDEDEEMSQKKGKKRACNPENWVMKKLKTLRNRGHEYFGALSNGFTPEN